MRLRLFLFLFVFSLLTLTPPGGVEVYAQDSIKESEELDFAQGLLSRGMYDMAINEYQKFIATYPHSNSLSQAYLSLAEGYFLSQNFNKAMDAFTQFNQLYPNSDQMPVSVLRLGQIDIQEKKYQDAVKEFNAVDLTKIKPEMVQNFYFYTAQAYAGEGDTNSALGFYQKTAQVKDAHAYSAYAYEEIGKIQAQNGKYPEALNAFASALQVVEDDSLKGEIIYKTAEVQFLSGNYAQAINGFNQVLSQYPSLGIAHEALANMLLAYFNSNQYDQLLQNYRGHTKLIKDDETDFAIHFAAVMGYIELNKFTQANTLLDRMLAFANLSSQERAKIFIKKADIDIRQKKFKDGLSLLEAYAALDTDDADETLFLRGQGFYGLDDFDHAFSYYENVNLNFPNSRFAQAALLGEAHSRKQAGRFKEAEDLFSKYYQGQQVPALKSEALYDSLMMAMKSNDIQGTITTAQEYLKEFPQGAEYSDVLIGLADTYGDHNQSPDAINLLQGYLATPQASKRPNSANFLLGYNEQITGNSDKALAAYALVDSQKEAGKFYTAAMKNMAIIYLTQKNYDQARAFFDKLISLTDQNYLQVKTYVWVCNEYLKLKKYNDVFRVAALAEKHFKPKDLEQINYFKAEAFRAMGNCPDAINIYTSIESSTQKDAFTGSAHIGHGLCLASSQKLDDAKAEFQKAIDENSDDYTITAHAQFETANLDHAQGDDADALKLYMLIATIYESDYYCSQSLLRSGAIFESMKKNDDAVKMYSEIVNKYPNSEAAKEAHEKLGVKH